MTSAREWLCAVRDAHLTGERAGDVANVVAAGLAVLDATETGDTEVASVGGVIDATADSVARGIAHGERRHGDHALLQVLRGHRDVLRASATTWGRVLRALETWGVR